MRRKVRKSRKQSIGLQVKTFRLHHGFTQQQMGELIGLKANQVSALELGTIKLKDKQDYVRAVLADLSPRTVSAVKKQTITQVKDTTLEIAKQAVKNLSDALEKQALLIIRSLVDTKLQEQ